VKKIKIGEYLAKLQITSKNLIVSCTFFVFNGVLAMLASARDNHVLACNFAKYSPILIFFTHILSNKHFLIWLLTIPPHLKYVATLPCNLWVMACFADINV